jgi:uncharacterized protein YneR
MKASGPYAAPSPRGMLLLLTLVSLLAGGAIFQSSSAAQEASMQLNPKTYETMLTKGQAAPVTEQAAPFSAAPYPGGQVIEIVDGQSVCRDATEAEARMLMSRDREQYLHPLDDDSSAHSPAQQDGMKIILRGTAQLERFPEAKAAFLRAARRWEAVIQSPVTLVIDVDYGPTWFGQPIGNFLGLTNVQWIGSESAWPAVRSAMIGRASNAQEAALYSLLPQSQVPTDIGATAGVFGPAAVFRALGLIAPVANPDSETQQFGPPPAVGFNSAKAFDFDPSDGIAPDKYDFDAVAVHEIGHALGFQSNVGNKELQPTIPNAPSPWDIFRFRPGVTTNSFSTAQRVQSSGGEQIFFGGGPELPLSTGRGDASGGDGRQCSHWKDDSLNGGVFIGIMDPVLPIGRREEMTPNDLRALDLMGYQLKAAQGGDTVALTSGAPQTGSIPAPQQSGSGVIGATQYAIQVPAGAAQLKVDLSGNQDVDLFVRFGSRVAIQNGAIVADAKSESATGNETITITPGSSPALQAGTYYIAVGNFGPGAASFTVTATVSGGGGPTPTPGGDTVALTSGAPRTGAIPAPQQSGSGVIGATQYTIQVPAGAAQLKVDLNGNQDVDLFVRFGSRIAIQNGAIVADAKSESATGNETITITPGGSPALQAGTYYIAVGNFGPGAASFTVTATVSGGGGPTPTPTPGGDTVALTSGAPRTGAIPAPQQSGSGVIGATQYTIQVPAGAAQLKIDLSGNPDVDLFVRFGSRIAIQNGAIVADAKSESATGNETITLTPGSSPTLQAGTYYIAVGNFGPGAASFTVTATVSGGGGPTPTPTPGPGNRIVRVGQAGGAPGGQVSLPIELVAQGDENALGFSLTFDPAVLGNPQAAPGSDASGATLNANTSQAASGRLGLALSLPFGQKFSAGTRQIVVVNFTIAGGASGGSTPVGFGDQPIAREISDVSARALQAAYAPGAVSFAAGLEGDVAPRPNGNGAVTITDWVQIGRFVAGQDAASGGEFQRADTAPRDSRGNGSLTITDWVQAGRYAAGLDPATPAGGPGSQGPGVMAASRIAAASGARSVRIRNGYFERGQQSAVLVELDAVGNENALCFSLTFDPARLRFVSAAPGGDLGGATLNVNTGLAAKGQIGLALALPAGQTIQAGMRQIVVVNFAVATKSEMTTATIGFGDQPVTRELSDAYANPLPADFAGGTLNLVRSVTTVSAASFTGQALASETNESRSTMRRETSSSQFRR